MMSYCTVSKEKVKAHGEVFTPAGVVFEMVMQGGLKKIIRDVDKTIFDPAVGEGQFPCAELVMKMFCQIENLDEETALRALKSLYGMDIQELSVLKAQTHLLMTIYDTYKFFTGKKITCIDEAGSIVAKNIMIGDSLDYMKSFVEPKLF